MHYLFERRLNMVEVAIHDLKDEDLQGSETARKLADEYSVTIPDLKWEDAKYTVKKEKLSLDNAPEGFHEKQHETYAYLQYTVPFTDKALVPDILKLAQVKEGLSITADEVVYREFSHDEIKEDEAEIDRIKANAIKASSDVQLTLDEFAANAVEFNQVTLPAAIAQKLTAEKQRRAASPAYAAAGHDDRKAD